MNLLSRLLFRRRLQRDVSDEIRAHLDERVDELVASGLDRATAMRRARREFGNVALIEEEGRDVWRWGWIEDLLSDVRFAFRQLRRSPAFAAAGALTLALGIGANTAVFAVVHAVLLRPLPFLEPDRLVTITPRNSTRLAGTYGNSYPNYFDMRAENDVFEQLAAFRRTEMTLTDSGTPIQLRGLVVSWNLFTVLRVTPSLGRPFTPDDERPESRTVIVSHSLWQATLNANPAAVGQTIELNRQLYTIAGVMPEGFAFPLDGARPQIWIPLAVDARSATVQPVTRQRGARMLGLIGRLRDGVTLDQASAQMTAVAASLARRYPNDNRRYPEVRLTPAIEALAGASREPLILLAGAVALVLLLACANIANLLLSRTTERGREFALRAAIGAGRARIVRQIVGESMTLSLVGSAIGVAVAVLLLRITVPLAESAVPRIQEARIDGSVLLFSLAVAVITSVLFSLAPLTRLRRGTLNEILQYGGRTSASASDRLRSALVVGQVAIGLMLVSGASLLTASYVHMTRRDPGFDRDRLLTFEVTLPGSEYPRAQQLEFHSRLIERLEALRGVESAAVAMPLPLTGSTMRVAFDIERRPADPQARPAANIAIVSPGFFETVGIPVRRGRAFTDHDDAASVPVVIVNQAFADQFFPGEDALGTRIRSGATSDERGALMREIVGIVGNARQSPLGSAPDPIYYFAYRQMPWCCPSIVVRATGSPAAIEADARSVLSSIDRRLPMYDVRTADRILSIGLIGPRFLTLLLGSFATIGLLLTAVGLYGLLNYAVVKQTREIGVRMALGAGRSAVLSAVLGRAMLLVSVGTAIGVAGSLASSRLLRNLLVGVEPTSPALLAIATLVIVAAAGCAAYLPARRAASVDPTLALRHE